MLVRDRGGGGGGTIVVNAGDLRRASSLAVTTAEGLQELANRIATRPIPELPPEIAGIVPVALAGMATSLGGRPAELVSTAQELRARAFWADAADRLAAGYELEGPLLDEFKAGMASGVLPRFADPFQRELALDYFEQLKEREDPGGIGGFFKDVGGGIADFATGAFDSVKDPALMLYHLAPGTDGWTGNWGDLGKGLAHGVTHPIELGKSMLALDALQEKGFVYWAGNVAPSAVAAFFTGGGSAALRGASATERVAVGASRAPEWLRKVREGRAFDAERSTAYPHNQVYVDKGGGDPGYWVLDSYDNQAGEIVSRKLTHLGGVQETTARGYLDELATKYAPGARIAPVPSAPAGLTGDLLRGDMILEVPPQHVPIPDSVREYADELGIQIRDSNGHVYAGPEAPGAAHPGHGGRAAGAGALTATGAERAHEDGRRR